MDSLIQAAAGARPFASLARARKRLSRVWTWGQIALSLPFTLMMLAVVLLLAVPDLLRRNARRWDRYGER